MRIDLPQCGFKYCRYSFDGNCTNKNRYETCEYQLDKAEIERLKTDIFALQYKITVFLEAANNLTANVVKEFVAKLKEHKCSYDLDNYHSFEAIDVDDIDDAVKEFLGEDYDR